MSGRIHTLANGVRVVCTPMAGIETIALSVVAGAGARAEAPPRAGWAHLLEHMVFKGAGPRSARDIAEAIEAEGGSINAATGYERTSFHVRALAGGLPLGLEVVADLMLRPTLDPAELEREKGVIAQEIAEAADAPDDLVFQIAQAAAFPAHALGRPILGTMKSVAAADPEALEAWRGRLYRSERLVVSAAGAVDEDGLLALTERTFGDAANGDATDTEPPAFGSEVRGKARALEQAHLVFMLPGPSARDDDYYAFRVFAEALGGGMASRLFQEAREKRGLAYAIDAYAETYSDTGVLGVYAGCAAKDAPELAKVCAAEIRKLAAEIEPAELARAKAQLKAHLLFALESPVARAEAAAGQTLLFGRTFDPAEMAASVEAVTTDDVLRLGERLLQPGRATGAVLGPRAALGAGPAFAEAMAA